MTFGRMSFFLLTLDFKLNKLLDLVIRLMFMTSIVVENYRDPVIY